MIETNPQALYQAAKADEQRKAKRSEDLGVLHGIPVLLKDNIATEHDEGRQYSSYSVLLLILVVFDQG